MTFEEHNKNPKDSSLTNNMASTSSLSPPTQVKKAEGIKKCNIDGICAVTYLTAKDFRQIWERTKVCQYSRFMENYKLLSNLAEGGFGVVMSAIRRVDLKLVAVKYVKKSRVVNWHPLQNNPELIVPIEVALLEHLNDVDGVIKLLDVYVSRQVDGFLIVMENIDRCTDMFDYITEMGRLPETVSRCYFRQIVETVIKIKEKGVYHRDIKDENILIDIVNDKVILIDFGSGAFETEGKYKEFQGTKVYAPPEWFTEHAYEGEPSSVWMLGILLFVFVTGDVPFKNESEILDGTKPKLSSRLPKDLRHLILWCMTEQAELRPSLAAILEHPWLKKSLPNHSWLASLPSTSNNSPNILLPCDDLAIKSMNQSVVMNEEIVQKELYKKEPFLKVPATCTDKNLIDNSKISKVNIAQSSTGLRFKLPFSNEGKTIVNHALQRQLLENKSTDLHGNNYNDYYSNRLNQSSRNPRNVNEYNEVELDVDPKSRHFSLNRANECMDISQLHMNENLESSCRDDAREFSAERLNVWNQVEERSSDAFKEDSIIFVDADEMMVESYVEVSSTQYSGSVALSDPSQFIFNYPIDRYSICRTPTPIPLPSSYYRNSSDDSDDSYPTSPVPIVNSGEFIVDNRYNDNGFTAADGREENYQDVMRQNLLGAPPGFVPSQNPGNLRCNPNILGSPPPPYMSGEGHNNHSFTRLI